MEGGCRGGEGGGGGGEWTYRSEGWRSGDVYRLIRRELSMTDSGIEADAEDAIGEEQLPRWKRVDLSIAIGASNEDSELVYLSDDTSDAM